MTYHVMIIITMLIKGTYPKDLPWLVTSPYAVSVFDGIRRNDLISLVFEYQQKAPKPAGHIHNQVHMFLYQGTLSPPPSH